MPYLELEYVEGGSLADRLDGTPRPPLEAARLVETLARSIAAAHARGILHRDLKPANVLVTTGGHPKITDFGLAKAMDVDSGLTGSGEVLGTPSYMAPEQAEGRAKQAGPPVDVYALGAVLYELLTGRPPFRGATLMETLEQVRGTEPVPPSRLVPRLPRDLETICLKCLNKEPSGRYASATDLAEDLGRFAEGRPIHAATDRLGVAALAMVPPSSGDRGIDGGGGRPPRRLDCRRGRRGLSVPAQRREGASPRRPVRGEFPAGQASRRGDVHASGRVPGRSEGNGRIPAGHSPEGLELLDAARACPRARSRPSGTRRRGPAFGPGTSRPNWADRRRRRQPTREPWRCWNRW